MIEASAQPSGAIGIFDSGVGGLTVLRSLREAFPEESFIYLGDTARVPYGSKSPETVSRYALNITAHLIDEGCKAIVIACNTASAYAGEQLRAQFSVPIIDVVQPMAEYISAHSKEHTLILGTRGTVQSGAYPRAIAKNAPKLRVTQQACPLFVPLAEEGWTHGEVPRAVADRYLTEAFREGVPDHLVLGCTHYPILREVIAQSARSLSGGKEIQIVDSGRSTAQRLQRWLATPRNVTRERAESSLRFLVTDSPQSFSIQAEAFLGTAIKDIEHVDIQTRF